MTGKCTSCGAQLAKGARFCSLCGTASPVTPAPSQTMGHNSSVMPTGNPTGNQTAAPYRPPVSHNENRQRNAVFITGGAIVMALVLFLLLKASGVLGAKASEMPTAAVLTAPQTKVADAPVLGAPEVKKPEAPVLTAPTVKGNPMPEDVIAYLRWLKQFEAARRSLEFRGNAAYLKIPTMITMKVMASMDENNDGEKKPNVGNEIEAELGNVVQELNGATQRFQSYAPPNPCAALANAYNRSLATKVKQTVKMQGAIGEIFRSFSAEGNTNSSAQDMLPQLLQEMSSKAMSQEADAADLATNEALNAVRAQYTDIPEDIDAQHFDIKQVDLNINTRTMIPPGMGSGFGM